MRVIPIFPESQMAPLLAGYSAMLAHKRRVMLGGFGLLALAAVAAGYGAEVDLGRFWANLGNFGSYFTRIAHLDSGDHAGAFVWSYPSEWFGNWRHWLFLLWQTLLIAYLGTVTGAVFAVAGALLSSNTTMPYGWVRFAAKRVLEFGRSVPDLVFALIFVQAFGLGTFPGVLAIVIHTTGALGKLYAEVAESIDLAPVEGVRASGGGWLAQMRYGVLPQVLPSFASYGLLRFEINVRSATVLGFVSAGGIGEALILSIRSFYYSDISAIMVMLMVTVFLIDMISEKLRHRLLAWGA